MNVHYFIHGLIILLTGLISGLPFSKSIKRDTNKQVAWRVVHSGGSMGGVMLIAIGSLTGQIIINPVSDLLIFWGLVLATYALVIAMIVAAITGQRGIGNKENKSWVWKGIYISYIFGAIFSISSLTYLLTECISII